MRMRLPRPFQAVATAAVLSLPVAGSDLTVDGLLVSEVILGESVHIEITGTPGKIPVLLADLQPGPTFLLGQFLPIGFSPFLQVRPQQVLSPAGVTSFDFDVPNHPLLANRDVYLLAVVLDEAAPFGLDFSNGAQFRTLDAPAAGSVQGAVVGRTVLLDGSDAAQGEGTPKPGFSLLWSLVSKPLQSQALIENPTQPFATFTPDVPGDYTAHLQVFSAQAGPYESDTTVHAWSVTTTPHEDGGISIAPSYDLYGEIEGPTPMALTLDGQPLALAPNGSFGPIPVHVSAAEVGQGLHFRLTHPDGATANHHMTLFQGFPLLFENPSNFSLSARLDQSGLSKLAVVGEAELEAYDLGAVLLTLPPQEVANDEGPFGFTYFSATVDFTSMSYDPDMDLALNATPSGIHADVSMYDIRADFDVYGVVLEIPYFLNGYITTSPTTISTDMVASPQNGFIDVTLNNLVVDRANFDFELTGFIGTLAEVFVIESAVKEQVEDTIASEIHNQLGPAMEEILNSFVLAGNLEPLLGIDVNIDAPIAGVVNDSSGVTIRLDGSASVGVPNPGSPPVLRYRGTPSLAPMFASTTPGGQPYEAALSVSDDFVNQVLAACTAAGLLDGDLSSLFPDDGKVPLTLTSDDVALLFPDAGFEHFTEGTSVRLQAHGTVPPVLTLDEPADGMGSVRLDNLEVEFEVETPYGALPMLTVALSGVAVVDMFLAPDATLELAVTDSMLELSVLRIYPGTDPVAMDGQVQYLNDLFAFAIPGLLDTIGTIPLPSLEAAGLGIIPTEANLFGLGGLQLGLFGTLLLVPAGG
jgi:hypothetical protein